MTFNRGPSATFSPHMSCMVGGVRRREPPDDMLGSGRLVSMLASVVFLLICQLFKNCVRRQLRQAEVSEFPNICGTHSHFMWHKSQVMWHPTALDIQIRHLQRILFDELTSRFHGIAHERREDIVGGHRILDAHLH